MPRRAAKPPADLPAFVAPMLATFGTRAFDGGKAWLFEVKWDGFRSLARRDAEGARLIGRRKTDYTARFPEITKAISRLPPGLLLDGEIVAMRADGKPDFTSLLRAPSKPARDRAGITLIYVAFDLLYDGNQPVTDESCEARRERLRRIVAAVGDRRVVMSEGVVGGGVQYFQAAVAAGLEGVIAKRLDAPYRPGVRTDAWLKFKARQELLAVVVGYEPSAEYGLRSLVIAAPVEGELQCVGRVGSGVDRALAAWLLPALRSRERATPTVPCPGVKGRWVEPTLFCRVSYAEVLASGRLRQPVLESMVDVDRKQ